MVFEKASSLMKAKSLLMMEKGVEISLEEKVFLAINERIPPQTRINLCACVVCGAKTYFLLSIVTMVSFAHLICQSTSPK